MSTNTPLITVDQALGYLESYKDTENVDHLAMVETFLVQLEDHRNMIQLELSKPITTNSVVQPALRPVTMGLFPTMGSLQSVVDLANAQLPVQNPNSMLVLLMIYHNTLLSIMEHETNSVQRK